jgi:hypothetical protein
VALNTLGMAMINFWKAIPSKKLSFGKLLSQLLKIMKNRLTIENRDGNGLGRTGLCKA